jgi:hypothetical protein
VRHAQYRQELADWINTASGLPVQLERPEVAGTLPALAVTWTGSQLSRGQVGGWLHSYDVELRAAERGPVTDSLVAVIADAVADWSPNTSHATAGPPTLRPVQVIDGEISYPAVLVSTVVTEPATD